MKKAISLDAPYKIGFYSNKLLFHVLLLVNSRSKGISSMDILKTVTPLKASAMALFPAKKARQIVDLADIVYSSVEDIKNGGNHKKNLAVIEEKCALIIHNVTENAGSKFTGRLRHLYDCGVALSQWHNRLEPPFVLDPSELMTLNMTMKASQIPDVPTKLITLNHDIQDGIEDIHDRIWYLHTEILEKLKLEEIKAALDIEGISLEGLSQVTGLPNLTTFDKDAENFFRSELLPFTLAFCDIDNFKKLNELVGHDEADEVIKGLGTFFKSRLTGRAKVYHRSGDEFFIIMENTDAQEAQMLMNRLLENLEKTSFETSSDKSIKLSISIGLSSFPQHGLNIETLRNCSNEAEKMSKVRGKNCCTIYKKI